MNFKKKIFSIRSNNEFKNLTLDIFHYQVINNQIYRNYLQLLKIDPTKIKDITEIPYLPISFFKTHRILSNRNKIIPNIIFTSSGTTGIKSKHYISDLSIYNESIINGFEFFYGSIKKFKFIGLFPYDRKDSSLIYMIKYLIHKTVQNGSRFLSSHCKEKNIIFPDKKNILLFGLSSCLLDFIEKMEEKNEYKKNVIIMETGGMKGVKKEIIREELHDILKKSFIVNEIHSEYGMTELLSQAYSKKDGIFRCPPWMKIYIRDTKDPFIHIDNNKIGGIDIINLSNYLSCPFIATEDLGKKINDKEFEVLGRMDFSDIRGCNVMTIM
ncbi:LuxE/PaaK family acyltransferase [Blattabacterium cuenoti]|uniref:LuxE/PaaK family acyltransferase n=1 Tax=Blattabacterium cuenoti TaxID=1653831 RepID=UPI00163CB786|nr:LuxE family acyl-protein synthetase/acyl-CoA reductase [Blattabacterium cuenoti]